MFHLDDYNRILIHFCALSAFLNTTAKVSLLKVKSYIKILQQLHISLGKN